MLKDSSELRLFHLALMRWILPQRSLLLQLPHRGDLLAEVLDDLAQTVAVDEVEGAEDCEDARPDHQTDAEGEQHEDDVHEAVESHVHR